MGVKILVRALQTGARDPLLNDRQPDAVLRFALSQAWTVTPQQMGADPAVWSQAADPDHFSSKNYAGIPEAADDTVLSLPVRMNRGTENNRIVARAGRLTLCDVAPGQASSRGPNGEANRHALDQLQLYADFGCKPQWLTWDEAVKHAESQRTLSIGTGCDGPAKRENRHDRQ
jgi:penicillin amidase